jgi:hypothetical protein
MILDSAEIGDVRCADNSDSVWYATHCREAQTSHSLRFWPYGFGVFANALHSPSGTDQQEKNPQFKFLRSLGWHQQAEGLREFKYLKIQLYFNENIVEKSRKYKPGDLGWSTSP